MRSRCALTLLGCGKIRGMTVERIDPDFLDCVFAIAASRYDARQDFIGEFMRSPVMR